MKGKLLLGVQLVGLLYIFLSGRLFAAHPFVWPELAGWAVAVWAVLTITPRRLHPLPEPRRDARLVTRGPYRWIRHPIYSGLLVVTLALVLNQLTLPRLVVWLVLLATLLTKLDYEETLLTRRFPEYAAYRKRTKRLIPFVY